MTIDFGAALRKARHSDPASMPAILAKAAAELGGADLVVYLIDFGQTTLEPLPDFATHAEVPTAEPVSGTSPGRAFTEEDVVSERRGDAFRVWAPLLEGSDRTGVIALTLSSDDDRLLEACKELGLLAGYLIAAQARCTDMYNLHRRRLRMSLAASLQWDLLPPLVLKTERASVAGFVEPAYEVGGDCFDYAANGSVLDFVLMDAMGHGVGSALIASLAMGAYRHDRRESQSLADMHRSLAATIENQYSDLSFVTGIVGRVDVDMGELTWTNAGHPLPLLIRAGEVIDELQCPPTPPWGVLEGHPTVASESLEPGDSLLLYTDGVIEARTPDGDKFGVERLIELANRSASTLMRPETMARRLVQGVCEHQVEQLDDDATIVVVRWDGPGNG